MKLNKCYGGLFDHILLWYESLSILAILATSPNEVWTLRYYKLYFKENGFIMAAKTRKKTQDKKEERRQYRRYKGYLKLYMSYS